MRPTRRGYVVVAVVVGAVAAGAVFGARALDAVVLPGVVALAAAVLQLRRASVPAVNRTLPPAETAGVERTITLSLDGDSGVPATVRDRLPAGVAAAPPGSETREAAGHAVVDAAIGGADVSYTIVPRRRGAHEIGPATVVVTDVLGLLQRPFVVDTRDTLVAYPRIGTLPAGVRAALRAASVSRDAAQRDEFDDLREYVRGDALRDVHWKSSARHDRLMVMEFADRSDPDRVTVAAGVAEGAAVAGGDAKNADAVADDTVRATAAGDGAGGAATPADRMADAAATVCVSVVRDGGAVSLTTPSGRAEASPGRVRPALDHLAGASGGRVPAGDADVVVVADAEGVVVRLDGREHRFEGAVGDATSLRTATEGSDETGTGRPHDPEAPGDAEPAAAGGRAIAPDHATDGGVFPDGGGGAADGESGARVGADGPEGIE